MKTMIAAFAVVCLAALAMAHPGEHEGGHDGGHGDHATEVKHGHPVHIAKFHTPGIGHFHNWAPKIEGHLDKRGFGPHVSHHHAKHHHQAGKGHEHHGEHH